RSFHDSTLFCHPGCRLSRFLTAGRNLYRYCPFAKQAEKLGLLSRHYIVYKMTIMDKYAEFYLKRKCKQDRKMTVKELEEI
ncbi:MAG: hypothetical protein MR698_07805, partial [Selenomonas sp.]|nr:hypothetical protein [Selenomonas sp.]